MLKSIRENTERNMSDKIKFSAQAYGQRHTVSIPDDSDIFEVGTALSGLLRAIGFADATVEELYGDSFSMTECEEPCCEQVDTEYVTVRLNVRE